MGSGRSHEQPRECNHGRGRPAGELLREAAGIGDIAAARTIIEGWLAKAASAANTISLTTSYRVIESDPEVRRRIPAIPIARGDTKAKQALAEAKAELATPRLPHVFKPRGVIEFAEAHVQAGKLAPLVRLSSIPGRGRAAATMTKRKATATKPTKPTDEAAERRLGERPTTTMRAPHGRGRAP